MDAWRDLRLSALEESPYAFSTTHAEAAAWTPDRWLERTRTLAGGTASVMFVADSGVGWEGCAGAFLDDDDEGRPQLISMWVAPPARRHGVGIELVDAVIGWARDGNLESIRLFVTDGNTAAQRLYEKCGFVVTGRTLPLPRTPPVNELEMRRHLP
ncbi:MAG: hypothetical protein QOK05_423 [Chloroflexota bacterium]|nr:hypothetical protein [Chloroflexota bacterium]